MSNVSVSPDYEGPLLAEVALESLEDMLDEFELEQLWNRLDALEDWEPAVVKRYTHGDCDQFATALHEATQWPIVSLACTTRGFLHRLVRNEEGRYLDATGWVEESVLLKRYGFRETSTKKPILETIQGSHGLSGALEEEERREIAAFLIQSEKGFLDIPGVHAWVTQVALDEEWLEAPTNEPITPSFSGRKGP